MDARTNGLYGKKLLVLGAGLFQIRGIQLAKSLGLKVYTLDNIPDNPGHRFADYAVHCSTTDPEEVLHHAREQGIDGICTFASDVALDAWAYVSENLDLVGPSPEQVKNMSDKAAFRRTLASSNLYGPSFFEASSSADLEKAISLKFPIMVKPSRSSGSKGITRIDVLDKDKLEQAYRFAQSYSLNQRVVLEEFIEGVEIGGDAFLVNGEIVHCFFTEKHKEHFWVEGHSLPTNISQEQQLLARKALIAACSQCDYKDGPLNFDILITGNQVFIIEMSMRTGGNGIPLIIHRTHGPDFELATIYYSLGFKPEFEVWSTPIFHSSLVLSSKEPRKTDSFTQDISIEGVVDVFLHGSPHMITHSRHEGGSPVGYVVYQNTHLLRNWVDAKLYLWEKIHRYGE